MKNRLNHLAFDGIIRLKGESGQECEAFPLVSGTTIEILDRHQGTKTVAGLHHLRTTGATILHRSIAVHQLHGTQGHQEKGEEQENYLFEAKSFHHH